MMRSAAIHTPPPRRAPFVPESSQSNRRIAVVGVCLGVLFAALVGRSMYLQLVKQTFLQGQGSARYSRVMTLEANRGMITDRNGEPLAISSPVKSIWASPVDMDAIPAGQLQEMARLLDMTPSEINTRLADKRKEFVYVKRQISPELAQQVMALKIPGVFWQQEYRRFYPSGDMMAQVLGYCGVDGKGQEGMELARESSLAGQAGSRHVIKDRRGNIIEDIAAIEKPRDGQTLAVSIDRRIQYLAFRELQEAVTARGAKAGSIVVLDAHTGEVLALANVPTFNPNNRERMDPAMQRNRAVTDQYEPGSTFKPFVIARALDVGLVKPTTLFNTEPYSIAGKMIRDTHFSSRLDVKGILEESSDIGSSKIALMMPPQTLWTFLSEVGFGRRPQTGFPGETPGRLRAYKTWRPIEQAIMGYGYGVAVSLLQLTRAYTVFTNDGMLLPISFVKLDQAPEGQRVLSAATAENVKSMLLAVTRDGTGKRAQVLGFNVGGKTGTAHKLGSNGAYTNRYVGSFVGFAPAVNPRLIIGVMIDDPNTSNAGYFGGVVAAPVFSSVMAGSLRILGVPPDAPNNSALVLGDDPIMVNRGGA